MTHASDFLYDRLLAQSNTFHKVVDFDPSKEKIIQLDFSKQNTELSSIEISDLNALENYVNKKLKIAKAKFAIGGYNENRELYNSKKLFSTSANGKDIQAAPRTIHLGIDIWGEEGTKVYAPLGGMVHSFAFNNHEGDYGATLILLHQLDTLTFYTLYGHLSLEDIANISEFQYIVRGHVIGHFGKPEENGNWPPHLHFQVIKDIGMHKGDYPGVCTPNERKKYLASCPDPNAILNLKVAEIIKLGD